MTDWNMSIFDDIVLSSGQQVIMNMLRDGKTQTEIAKELGKATGTIGNQVKVIRQKATTTSGTSILQDPNTGEKKLIWVKNKYSEDAKARLNQSILEEIKSSLPKIKPSKAPKKANSELMNCFVITDFHLGLLAHKEETHDADWDLKKGEQLLYDWFIAAIESAPNADYAVFAQMGDFMHWDGLDAVTPASKHVLDADSRFHKLVRAAIRVIRRIITELLKQYKHVYCYMMDANHDPASGVWLREFLSAMYEDEKRITVDLNPNPYACLEFGKVALFFHHGHKRKVANIDTVFAGMYRDVFGRTKHSYAHLGHIHSVEAKETNLMIVEQHRTLAPADAYAARGGWISGRDAKVITYHHEFGEVARLTISPDMVYNG